MSNLNPKVWTDAWWTKVVRQRDNRILVLEKQCENHGDQIAVIAKLTQNCASLNILVDAKQAEVDQLLGKVERLWFALAGAAATALILGPRCL